VRLAGSPARPDFLAISRDHQQRVVDGEAEAEPGGDVEREQGGVGDASHDPQHQQRADDRDHPEQQRDRGGDDPPEHEQQEERQDRKGDQLCRGQVLAGLVVGLVEAGRVAGQGGVEPARRQHRADVFGGVATGVLDVGGGEVGGDRERLGVAGDQRGGGGFAQRVDDPSDVFDLGDPAAEPVDLSAEGGGGEVEAAAVGGADEDDQARVGVVAELAAQQRSRPLALRGAVGEPGRLEVALDVFADHRGEDDEGGDGGEDELRVLPGEVGDPVHAPAPYQISKRSLGITKRLVRVKAWVAANTARSAASPPRSTRSASAGRC
jgi:hypothetical protein